MRGGDGATLCSGILAGDSEEAAPSGQASPLYTRDLKCAPDLLSAPLSEMTSGLRGTHCCLRAAVVELEATPGRPTGRWSSLMSLSVLLFTAARRARIPAFSAWIRKASARRRALDDSASSLRALPVAGIKAAARRQHARLAAASLASMCAGSCEWTTERVLVVCRRRERAARTCPPPRP